MRHDARLRRRHARARASALMFDALPVAHHLLLGHGRAVAALRAAGGDARSAAPTTTRRCWPASDDEADVGGRRALRRPVEPAVRRPDAARALPGRTLAAARGRRSRRRRPGDDPAAARLLRRQLLQPDADRPPPADEDAEMPVRAARRSCGYPTHRLRLAGRPRRRCASGWSCSARATAPRCRRSTITENGCAYDDGPDADGVVDDQARIDYLDGAPARRRRGDRRRASTSAATTPGR